MCCVPTVAAVPSSRRRPENHIRCVCVQLCVEKGCVPWSSGTCAPGELDAVIILIWMGEILRFFKHLLQTEGSCLCVPRTGGVERVCPRRFRNWPQGFRATCHPSTCALAMCVARKCSIRGVFPNNFCVCPRYWPPATFLTHGNVCARTMCVEQRWCVPAMPRFVCPRDRWFGKGVSPALHLNNFYVCPRYLCVPATPAATPWCGIGVSPLLFFRCELGFPANRTR